MYKCIELRKYPSKLRNNLVESVLICVGEICPLTEKLRNKGISIWKISKK